MSHTFLIIAGLAILTGGAELLVRGATRLAYAAGLSRLVVGLTVVSIGTSAPEIAVSLKSALAGQADVAVGNVVGSNIFNILLILGISAVIAPLTVSQQLVRLDVPVMIGVSGFAWLLCLDGAIGRIEGAVLFGASVAYTVFLVYLGRKQKPSPSTDTMPAVKAYKSGIRLILISLLQVGVGLGLLILGGGWFVNGAVTIARSLGVSELLIGLTVVSAGTSLPEAATSVMATIRGQRDIAVGNVVGSNIFNILLILGSTALIADGVPVAPAAWRFDIPVMLAVALACLPIFFTGGRISRWEGALFLAYYVAYVTFLALADTMHLSLPTFSGIMAWFILPATGLGLGLSVYYAVRGSHASSDAERSGR